MAIPSSIPIVLGSLAVFTSSALVAVHAILARELDRPSSPSIRATRAIAVFSAALEGAVVVGLSAHLFFHIRYRTRTAPTAAAAGSLSSEKQQSFQPTTSRCGLCIGLSIVLCTVAAAVSVAALVVLSRSADKLPNTIFGASTTPFLAGASVTLGITYVAQLVYLIVAFLVARRSGAGRHRTRQTAELGGPTTGSTNSLNNQTRSPASSTRVKPVPCSQTSIPAGARREKTKTSATARDKRDSAYAETAHRTPPGSSGGRSATETIHSLRLSLSHAIRPSTSRTRLISEAGGAGSPRSSAWRPTSLSGTSSSPASTCASRERDVRPSIDDFDSWDTSAVDPQNRQTVLETAVSPSAVAGRFLETIPASPTTSRSPSPGTPLDLEPPRSRQRRSRSYSPAPSTRSGSGARMRAQSHSQSPPPNEAHIHPLFRSDSPTPPPAVSAGTVVTAAPNGGRVMATDAQSLRTLSRMRSGSLPAVPSPLSRQGSFDDFGVRRGIAHAERPHTGGGGSNLRDEDVEECVCGDHTEDEDAERRARADSAERKMTPPIPEWILSAGARTSLSGYQSRKLRIQDGGL